MTHKGVGLGGVSPPKNQETFENLMLNWYPLAASKSYLGGLSPAKSQEIFENLVLKWCPLIVSQS